MLNSRGERQGSRLPHLSPYDVYRCRGEDHWCAITVTNEDEWAALCAATGHPEWRDDPRFQTMAARVAHNAELDALLGAWTAERPAADDLPLPWLLVAVCWAWLLALALFIAT